MEFWNWFWIIFFRAILCIQFYNYFDIIKEIQIYLPENEAAVKNGLLREFCRILFNEKKKIEVSLINDITYNRAVEILKDKNEYYKLLGY